MKLVPAVLLCAGIAWSQPAVPRYEVHRAKSPVVIDGKPDESAWAAAGKIELIFPWETQTGAKQKTIARLLWDDRNLYVAYECEDTNIVASHTAHDDPTYLDDAVEIFINPLPSQTGMYYGLEMNALGVLYDYVMYQSKYLFRQFDLQGVQLKTSRQEKGWSLEVAVPWTNFDALSKPPVVGTIWAANVNRWDGVEPNRRMSNWSDPMQPTPNPHVPSRFGQLVFVD